MTVEDEGRRGALLVVAKRPAAGRTKTRLSPPLAPAQAAQLYECFLQDTLEVMRQVEGVQPVLAYLPEGAEAYFATLAPDFELILQQGDRLGARLDHCLTAYLARGYEKAVIMSSDVPNIPPAYLASAFQVLDEGADVVLGPCDDGGYYLIGLKAPAPRLLLEVKMSTPRVTEETLQLAEAEGLRSALLASWYDVDNEATLKRLVKDLRQSGGAAHTRAALRRSLAGLDGLEL